MSDYGTMQARIARDLRRTTIADDIKNAILDAIKVEEIRHYWFNEGRTSATTIADNPYLSVPTNFLHPIHLEYYDSNAWVPIQDEAYTQIVYDDPGPIWTGRPQAYSMFASQVRLMPTPDAAYPVKMHFVKQLPTLTSDSDSNSWMTEAEILIRQTAKAIVCEDIIKGSAAEKEAPRYRTLAGYARDKLDFETLQRRRSGRLRPNRW